MKLTASKINSSLTALVSLLVLPVVVETAELLCTVFVVVLEEADAATATVDIGFGIVILVLDTLFNIILEGNAVEVLILVPLFNTEP